MCWQGGAKMKREPCDLGKYILSGLKDSTYNQSGLAKRCITSRQHICRIIYGDVNPSLWMLIKITRTLNLDLNEALRAFFGPAEWDAVMDEVAEEQRQRENSA